MEHRHSAASEMVRLIKAALPHTTFSVLGHIRHSPAAYKQSYQTSTDPARSYYETAVTASLPADHQSALSGSLRRAMSAYVDSSDEFATGFPILVGGGTGKQGIDAFRDRVLLSATLFGAARTVDSLFGWIDGEPARYMDVYGINGLSLDAVPSLDWRDGVRFVAIPAREEEWDELIPDHVRLQFREFGSARTRPDVLLCCDATARPVFDHPANIPSGAPHRPNIDTSEALPIREHWGEYMDALSLACDSCVHGMMGWKMVNDGVTRVLLPHGTSSWFSGALGDLSHSATLTPAKLREAEGLIDLLKRHGSSLRVCMHRWKMSFVRLRMDQLIDLRIALEALYASGSQNEARLRVSIHGACHLGKHADERRAILDQLGMLYNEASSVVHGRTQRNEADCDQARSLCRRGILKVLNEGAPDPDLFVLGSESWLN